MSHARELYTKQVAAISMMAELKAEFEKVHGHAPSIEELQWIKEVGATIFINESGGSTGGGGRAPSGGGGKSGGDAPYPCPDCGGGCWDNRETKKGNQPDFKCKDKNGCGWAGWLTGRSKAGGSFMKTVEDVFKVESGEENFSNEALEEPDGLPF